MFGVLVAAALLLRASGARAADDVPAILVTDSGPERALPIGSAYYLRGKSKSISEVRPIFVRIGTKTLFGNTGHGGCSAFAQRLKDANGAVYFVPNKKGDPASTVLTSSKVGKVKASEIWQAGDNSDAFAIAPWKRADDKDQEEFSVLVPQSDFFAPVGVYCLFVYKTVIEEADKSRGVRAALDAYAQSCDGTDAAACKAAAAKRDADLAALVPATALRSLLTASNAAVNPLTSLHASARRLNALLGSWSDVETGANAAPADGFTSKSFVIDAVADTNADDWGRALLSLLVERQALTRNIDLQKQTVSFVTNDGKVLVRTLQVSSDGERITAASRGGKTESATLDAKTQSLPFDGLDLTLRDLVEALRGRVRIAGEYQLVSDVRASLRVVFDTPKAPSEEALARLDELGKRAQLLSALIRESLLASQPAKAPPQGGLHGSRAETYFYLGRWLRQKVLVPCQKPTGDPKHASALERWGRGSLLCFAEKQAAAGQNPPKPVEEFWPNYHGIGNNPFEFVAGDIKQYRDALARWPAANETLATTVSTTSTLPTTPIPMQVSFSQDAWVFSYVTPVVGVALLTSPEHDFTTPYLAVQIHLVANPVDEPMWSGQFCDDVLRSFALELGSATGNGPWGRNDRFSGWKDLPPFMVGAAIHPLPYTSLSGGGAFLQRRRSPLSQEQAEFFASWYFSASVQINIPDIIAGLKGRTSQTKKD